MLKLYPMEAVKTKVVNKASYDKGFNKSVKDLKSVENKITLKSLVESIKCN